MNERLQPEDGRDLLGPLGAPLVRLCSRRDANEQGGQCEAPHLVYLDTGQRASSWLGERRLALFSLAMEPRHDGMEELHELAHSLLRRLRMPEAARAAPLAV